METKRIDLPPGRELDVLVAEKVMGWRSGKCNGFVDEYYSGWRCQECGTTGQWGFQGEHEKEPSPYSTDIAAAWEVVEKIEGLKPHHDLLIIPSYPAVAWEEAPVDFHDYGRDVIRGETIPHAICLAALRAVSS